MKRFPDDIFFDMFNINSDRAWEPKYDIYETEKYIVIKLEISGLNPNNVELTLSNDNRSLNVKGVRNDDDTEEEKIHYHQMQIVYGLFDIDIDLPHNVIIDRNEISAKYKDGMLIVKLAKSVKNKPMSIKIED